MIEPVVERCGKVFENDPAVKCELSKNHDTCGVHICGDLGWIEMALPFQGPDLSSAMVERAAVIDEIDQHVASWRNSLVDVNGLVSSALQALRDEIESGGHRSGIRIANSNLPVQRTVATQLAKSDTGPVR